MRLKSSAKLLSAIVLVSTMSLMTGIPMLDVASAAPVQPIELSKRQNVSQQDRALPRSLSQRVRRDLAARTGIPANQLRITEMQRRTWNNGCLGLPQANEMCTQALVEGWRVVVAHNQQTWVYRTNQDGRVLRLETAVSANQLPTSVANAVLREIERRSQVSRRDLRIVRAEQRTWRNGCLEIIEPGVFCTQALVPGWRIEVQGPNQKWIVRTDRTGSTIKLEQDTTQGTVKPVRMSDDDLPQAIERDVLFRAIASGGFIGQTFETILFNDGRVIRQRVNFNGTSTPIQTWRVSSQQMQQFRDLLAREHFERFDRLSFPATRGSADFITVTLTSPDGTTQYADSVMSELPRSLQTIIQAWNTLQRSS